VLYRLAQADGERAQEERDLPGRPVNELRLQLDPRGGSLGNDAAPELRFALHGYQLAFLARGGEPYQLAFGRADAAPAALPLATLIPGYTADGGDSQAGAFGLAHLAHLPDMPPAPRPVAAAKTEASAARSDLKKTGLWLVLLAGVGLLIGMAFSLLAGSSRNK
jgi:hypothetical protein